jgi:hypothetical protein
MEEKAASSPPFCEGRVQSQKRLKTGPFSVFAEFRIAQGK